ncbi:A disintegrin and metalloproteinase with thrombospondin motifs 9-like [Saccostrea cucullata]|uniref:A disintegrin and metalloproteinase with thrombospondin motifs 9-like n=1 Tax=Saccostrea cuccullata TaxID=36930 RepID=UPI002ED40574
MMESERNPASCSEIKECWPSSYDGEYWLYPKRFGRKSPVKVYCHNMSSPETAEEYVTLQRQNYFIGHDASHLISFARCTRNSLPIMRTEFSKVRINIESMSVVQEDFTFAMTTGNSSKVENVPFGTSSDCTAETWWEKRWGPCQLEGTFLIDLQDTGLSIVKSVGWVNGSADWFSEIRQFSRSADSTTVSCLVIGWCGNCLPNDTIILEPLTGAETTGTAQTVICD